MSTFNQEIRGNFHEVPEKMFDSEGNKNRKIKSDKVGLAIVSSLVDGTEITSDHKLVVTRNLPESSTYIVNETLNPLVTNPNPFYKNFSVIPNPVTSQTRIRPCLLTSNDPVSVFSSKQCQISSNVGVGLKNDNQDAKSIICSVHGKSGFLRLEDTHKPDEYSCVPRHGLIFEVVNMFINDCVLELPPSSQVENFSLIGELASSPGQDLNSSTQYLESDEFLEYCYDCNKALDGNDIYMYSDKPFCSKECREKEYMNDSNLKNADLVDLRWIRESKLHEQFRLDELDFGNISPPTQFGLKDSNLLNSIKISVQQEIQRIFLKRMRKMLDSQGSKKIKFESDEEMSMPRQLNIFSLNNEPLMRMPRESVNLSRCSTQYFESANFLKYCYICSKELDGEDIYMYSDKPFCSNECREMKYMNDRNLVKAKMSD